MKIIMWKVAAGASDASKAAFWAAGPIGIALTAYGVWSEDPFFKGSGLVLAAIIAPVFAVASILLDDLAAKQWRRLNNR